MNNDQWHQYLAAWYENLAATSSDANARQILIRRAVEYRDGTRDDPDYRDGPGTRVRYNKPTGT